MKLKPILLTLIIVTLVAGCDNKKKSNDAEFANYITKVTQGNVEINSDLHFVFVNDIVNDETIDINLEEIPLKFSPKIDGSAKWISKDHLVFTPQEPLNYGKKYQGVLKVAELPGNLFPENLKEYVFDFEVGFNSLTKIKTEISPKSPSSPKVLQLKSEIELAEKIDIGTLQEALVLKYDNQAVDFDLKEQIEGKKFNIVSTDIARDQQDHTISLELNAKKIGLTENYRKEHIIPPFSELKVVKIVQDKNGKNPRIRVQFSDKLSADQNLDGLISLSPKSDQLRLQRLGNSVLIDGGLKFGSTYTIKIQQNIKSIWGTSTKGTFKEEITFPNMEPAVEFASGGVFLPSDNDLKLQFYTCNLKRVHLEIKKVHNNRMQDFVSNEQISSRKDRKSRFNRDYESHLGIILLNKTLEISDDKNNWKLNEIDLSKLVNSHGKGVYLVRLNFNLNDLLTPVNKEYDFIAKNAQIYKPVVMSDIGLMVKKTKGNTYKIITTDLKTAQPMSGVNVHVKNFYYDKRNLKGTTGSNGTVSLTPLDQYDYYHYVIAQKGDDKTILKFSETEWNVSGFDVGGLSSYQLNTQAFCYTERGVYRPGDEINLSIIARHINKAYPDNRALSVELFNPRNKSVYTASSKENKDGFYNFNFKTQASDPTGNWQARFYIGNKYFSHTIKIETIVPYKLKTKLETAKKELFKNDESLDVNIDCKYLFGTPAAGNEFNLKAEITNQNKRFKKFSDFKFNNPVIEFSTISKTLTTSKFDQNGKFTYNYKIPELNGAPSGLNLKIVADVIEKGGRSNKNWINIPLNPYEVYVGIKNIGSYIKAGSDLSIPVIAVDPSGEPVSGKKIKFNIYRNSNSWWWQYNNRALRYKSDTYTELVHEGELVSGKDQSIIRYMPVEPGGYYIEVYDEEVGGHTCGMFFTAYTWGGNGQGDNSAGMLALKSNKEKYTVGETAKISFPSPGTGKILLSVEKDDEIVEMRWYEPEQSEQMEIEIPITKEMTPNVYASISLIQPHANTQNDRPLRMFGVLPLHVIDPNTKYDIKIKTSESFRPEEEFTVELQTSNHKQSQFTIAVVDEGLLDITQYKTPNPWKHFFKKIRLGVSTYDILSQVISANIGDVFKTFSTGGDMDYRTSQLEKENKKKRFKPVSIFQGPIETDANGYANVKMMMPNYVGSVRIMVVAANQKSYASAEKTVPVKKELMVLPTLPRVIGPDETFQIPISVFAMKENLGKVDVKIKVEGPLRVLGSSKEKLEFSAPDEQECFFNVKSKKAAGQAKITIEATNGEFSASNVIDLNVRPTSPRIFDNHVVEIEKPSTVKIEIPEIGIEGSNNATLTISGFPGLNFKHRLYWLIQYPYGCIEQTTSAVFPQLYLPTILNLPSSEKTEIEHNINAGIRRLSTYQLYSGGMSYWPGNTSVSEWGSIYSAHFLIEAKKLGFYVPDRMYNDLLRYLEKQANSNSNTTFYRVYRSYVLALAGKAVISELNVLSENYALVIGNTEKWLLASACSMAGLNEKVNQILKTTTSEVKDYAEFSGTYGSTMRDKGLMVQAMVNMNKMPEAYKLIKDIQQKLGSKRGYSTQTLAQMILANGSFVTQLIGEEENPFVTGLIKCPDGEEIEINTSNSFEVEVSKYAGQKIEIELGGKTTFKKVYANLDFNGIPLKSALPTQSKNLKLDITYFNDNGVKFSPDTLKQAESFWVHFHAENIAQEDVDEIALMYMLPSGWEVQNTRLQTEALPSQFNNLKLNREEYIDIRDDRIMWFFDLQVKKEYHKYWELDFVAKINTVTVGEYTLPATLMEAMYNSDYKATVESRPIKVVNR